MGKINNATFRETQRFRQLWIWLLMAGCTIVSLTGIFVPILSHERSVSLPAIVLGCSLPLLVVLLFLLMRLDTVIDASGINYRFFPVHRHMKKINWEDVQQAYLRRYRPIAEYGGWGLRYGPEKTSRAVNVRGNIGLQVVFKDGKKLLIGTQQAAAMVTVLKQLNKPGVRVEMP